jgi:hypothetical protein
MSGTEIGLLVGAGAIVYPVTVGLAARLWVWLLGWDISHDDEGVTFHNTCHGKAMRAPFDNKPYYECAGCRRRGLTWWVAILWPVAFPVAVICRTAYRTAMFTARTAKRVGPQAYTGDD